MAKAKAKAKKTTKKKASKKTEGCTVGRPTLYKKEYCKMLIEYFDIEPYKIKTREEWSEEKEEVVELKTSEAEANDFPTLAGFATKIGVHRDTLLEWSKVHDEFSGPYKRIKDFQENFLVTNGLKGLVNPSFAIFTAKNVLGWRDKQPDEDNVNITINLADRIAKGRQRAKKAKK